MHDESAAWNAEAHEWVDRIREGMGGRVHAHDASLYGLLPPPSGLTLDVGCGEGRISRELRARGYDVHGFDASETLVGEARRADPDGRYDVARIDALPVDDGAARLVVCVNVLPHIHDLRAAADELARVLAPGGALAMAYSSGPDTPIWVPLDRVARELEARGVTGVRTFSAGIGVSLLAVRQDPS